MSNLALDLFTTTLRDVSLAVGFGLGLGALTFGIIWAIQEWTAHFKRRSEAGDAALVAQSHVDIVEVPYDWAEHGF